MKKIAVPRRSEASPPKRSRPAPVALLVVADELERRHVVARLEETMKRTKALIHTPAGWDAAVAAIAVDHNMPAVACDLAINAAKPQVLLFVGSAASLAAQDDHDVFVGAEVAVWRPASADAPRRRIAQRSSPWVLRAATATRDARSWGDNHLVAESAEPDAVFGRLVVGEEAVEFWRQEGAAAVVVEFPGALALEPLGWDFLREAYGDDELPALSISGLWTPSNADHDESEEARLTGIDHALAFALEMLERLPSERTLDPLDLLADDGEWAHGGGEAETLSPALTGNFLQKPWRSSERGAQAREGPSISAELKDGFREDEVAALMEAKRAGRPLVPPPQPPDLQIRIDLLEGGNGLRFELNSEKLNYYQKQVGQTPFQLGGQTPLEYRESIRRKVREIAASGGSEDDLEQLGWRLYEELFPDELKAEYAEFRDQVETLQITSAEPWIPWEMVRPYSENWQDDHLCMRYAMTRWLQGVQPRNAFEIGSIALIEAAAVENEEPLDSAHEECLHLSTIAERCAVLNLSPPSADKDAVRALVRRTKEEQANLWHVAAHGRLEVDPTESYVVLCGRHLWHAGDMMGPHAQPIKLVRPLVFFNTCVVSEMSFAITGLAGWPKMWITDCQCGAFLGPRWSVESDLAYLFAVRFYDALVDERSTLGEAVRLARQAVREKAPGDPTWAAYTLYGHPNARVRFGVPTGSTTNGV